MGSAAPQEVFEYEKLKIILTETNEVFTVAWMGECDARKTDQVLGGFLQTIVRKLAGRRAIIDFSRFTFMNSSALNSILQFVRQLDQQAQTKIIYDTRIEWQLIAYRCMKSISRTLKQTDVTSVNG